MLVVCREVTCYVVRSGLEKWSLIGGGQLKHVGGCLMFMWCSDSVCSGWTLDVVVMVHGGVRVVWHVSCE